MHLGCACDSGFAYPAQDHHVGAGDMEQETPPQIAVGLRLHICQQGPWKLLHDMLYGGLPSCSTWPQIEDEYMATKHHSTVCSIAQEQLLLSAVTDLSPLDKLEEAMYWALLPSSPNHLDMGSPPTPLSAKAKALTSISSGLLQLCSNLAFIDRYGNACNARHAEQNLT